MTNWLNTVIAHYNALYHTLMHAADKSRVFNQPRTQGETLVTLVSSTFGANATVQHAVTCILYIYWPGHPHFVCHETNLADHHYSLQKENTSSTTKDRDLQQPLRNVEAGARWMSEIASLKKKWYIYIYIQ
jgi:hypothetical protein